MTEEEIDTHAKRLAYWHLDDGIEFSNVYEDDAIFDAGASEDEQRAIHDKANQLLRGIVL